MNLPLKFSAIIFLVLFVFCFGIRLLFINEKVTSIKNEIHRISNKNKSQKRKIEKYSSILKNINSQEDFIKLENTKNKEIQEIISQIETEQVFQKENSTDIKNLSTAELDIKNHITKIANQYNIEIKDIRLRDNKLLKRKEFLLIITNHHIKNLFPFYLELSKNKTQPIIVKKVQINSVKPYYYNMQVTAIL